MNSPPGSTELELHERAYLLPERGTSETTYTHEKAYPDNFSNPEHLLNVDSNQLSADDHDQGRK